MTITRWRLSWILLCLAGCVAPVTYDHPTKSLADKQRDYIECLATANQAAAGSGEWASDRAVRSAVFDNARDRYLAMCLESRGWVRAYRRAPGSSTVLMGEGPRPSNWVSAEPEQVSERRCQQEALGMLGYYDAWQDGRDSWWWQQALQRYRAAKDLDAADPEAPAQLRLAIDSDLQARGHVEPWRRCLVEAGVTGM